MINMYYKEIRYKLPATAAAEAAATATAAAAAESVRTPSAYRVNLARAASTRGSTQKRCALYPLPNLLM